MCAFLSAGCEETLTIPHTHTIRDHSLHLAVFQDKYFQKAEGCLKDLPMLVTALLLPA